MLLSVRFKANRRQRIAGKTLYTIYRNGKDSRRHESCLGSSLLHDRSRDNPAGQSRKSRNHEGPVHKQGAQEPAGRTHPDQTGKTDDNGPPLHHKLFQAEYRSHMDQ